MNRKTDLWDPSRLLLPGMLRRARAWVLATRRRRWMTGLSGGFFVLFVFPGLLGTAAAAESNARTAGSSVGSALAWTKVADSSGVQAANYLFATDHGSILHPGNTALSIVLGMEFAGWKIIVITAIWLMGYALSFAWLNLISKALLAVGHSLTGQIATPAMLITAATIGAFFVAWFVIRGYVAKATIQAATMVMVGVLGPIFLAEPLADVLSSNGLVAQGRDLGIEVAAGLNGNTSVDPTNMVATMQATLTDNFARRPLQVWNFGHVIDNESGCRTAWSVGVASGSENQVKSGIGNCGDTAARDTMNNPSFEQIATGVLLLLSGTILLLFGATLAIKVIWAALDTIYHGLMTIFGFAAGGFVYGPTQTFLIRNVVDGFVAAARMTAFTIFLGVYVLILRDLFDAAGDQVMVVFVIGAILEIIAIFQLKRLNKTLHSGNEWIANRFALAVQGAGKGGSGGGGSGSARAIGMGTVGANHSLTATMLPIFAAASTFGNSPITEWLAFGTRNPLRPRARLEKASQIGQQGFWAADGVGGPDGDYAMSYMHRPLYWRAALAAVEGRGGTAVLGGRAGRRSLLGASVSLQGLMDVGGKTADARAALLKAGYSDPTITNAIRAWQIVESDASGWTLSNKNLGHVVSAVHRVNSTALDMVAGVGEAPDAAAAIATLQATAFRFHRTYRGGVTLDHGNAAGPQNAWVNDYFSNPTSAKITELAKVASGTPGSGALAGISQINATRMMDAIGTRHADEILQAVNHYVANPEDPQLLREARRVISSATDTDLWATGTKRTPWNALVPPGQHWSGDPAVMSAWAAAHGPVTAALNHG
ncbi:hypothetical protein [Nocardia sp. alder85J]|uniref:hypothetical protein n=1 Tax=Nocardia sp. alder85J TaxID=2862949 RepID=UPI001CD629CF|nr:hypothetical protein [Nocardia sp. alder85J]MCX4096194.1 hypothetical protein [Nocardia sp. alder85J]